MATCAPPCRAPGTDGGTPLYLLLDDISGSSLIAGFAMSQWTDEWMQAGTDRQPRPDMEGVCIGFAPGSSALVEIRSGTRLHRTQAVQPLVNDHDPYGWHELAELPPLSMRRARRIDLWRDPTDGTIMIDSGFQDSAGNPPRPGRRARVRATAGPDTLLRPRWQPAAHPARPVVPNAVRRRRGDVVGSRCAICAFGAPRRARQAPTSTTPCGC